MNEILSEILSKYFKEAGFDEKVKVVKSKEETADFQCDDLFRLAKIYHAAPLEIGNKVIEKIEKDSAFKSVSLAPPGFINLTLSDEFINENLRKLIKKDILGADKENSTIVIDYGGPNIAKPLHVGHLRTAIIGQAINNILTFKGNKVISDVHLGDIGTQMGQVIYGILNDFKGQKPEDINLTLDYLNETYPKISTICKEDEKVHDECLEITKRLQDGDETYTMLAEKIKEISITDIKRLYDYLDVKFDYWYGESDAYKYFDEMLEFINKEGIIKEDDGALVIYVNEEDDKKEMPPCLIRKSDGAYLYATSDLGTIWQREKDFHPDNIIYVTDARQSLHFTQVFRAAKKAHIYEKTLEHFGYGTVNGPDNKPYKTRDGGALKLEDLIKEVETEFISSREENKSMDKEDIKKIVNAIIKFADLQNDLTRNYIFDIKKFSEVTGKTGLYILYTYLRINKLLSGNDNNLSDEIYNESDRNLRLKLLEVSDVINIAAKERKPHHIASYLYDLAVTASNFYSVNKMSEASGKMKNDYDIVLSFNNEILRTLLNLLGIFIPSKM